MLSAPLPKDAAQSLKPLGIDPEDADYQAAVGAALLKKAMSGNVGAIQLLATLTHDDPYVKAKQAEVRLQREELKEKIREFDLTRADKKEQAAKEEEMQDWAQEVAQAFDYDASRED